MDQENNGITSILRIPADIEQLGVALLHQQMWCWGQDIRRKEGNLLLRYGFTRERAPQGSGGSSAYSFHLKNEGNLMIWAFGFFYARPQIGGIFLKRTNFVPRLMPTSDLLRNIWLLTHLPDTSVPQTLEEGRIACTLLSEVLHWLSRYEHWVESTLGLEYRRRCLAKWDQPFLPPENVAVEWERLASLCQSFLPRDEAISGVC